MTLTPRASFAASASHAAAIEPSTSPTSRRSCAACAAPPSHTLDSGTGTFDSGAVRSAVLAQCVGAAHPVARRRAARAVQRVVVEREEGVVIRRRHRPEHQEVCELPRHVAAAYTRAKASARLITFSSLWGIPTETVDDTTMTDSAEWLPRPRLRRP